MRDRCRAKLSKSKRVGVEKPCAQVPENPISPPTALCRVDESSISEMAPGDIFLIDELEAMGANSEPAFKAVLACPLCGSRGLISDAQYLGFVPVICGARSCSGFFRIIDKGRFHYLPVN